MNDNQIYTYQDGCFFEGTNLIFFGQYQRNNILEKLKFSSNFAPK
jgi:hypothetical protein